MTQEEKIEKRAELRSQLAEIALNRDTRLINEKTRYMREKERIHMEHGNRVRDIESAAREELYKIRYDLEMLDVQELVADGDDDANAERIARQMGM